MSGVPFSTLRLAKRLQAGGFTSEQADTMASALADAATAGGLATKADFGDLVSKADLKADLAELKADLLKWMVSTIGIQTVVIIGAVVALVRIGAHP